MISPVSRKFSHSGSQWARCQRGRMGSQRGAHAFSLLHHLMIAVGQLDVLRRQHAEILVNHCEQFEPERKRRTRPVQPCKRLACACGRALAGSKVFRAHRHGPFDEAGHHQARPRIGMDHLRADTCARRLTRRHRLVGAVDVFLGSLAWQPHTELSNPVHPVGQPAQPFHRPVIPGQLRHLAECRFQLRLDLVAHCFPFARHTVWPLQA
jgi:hypothetical protein